jgi:hypothetical protein
VRRTAILSIVALACTAGEACSSGSPATLESSLRQQQSDDEGGTAGGDAANDVDGGGDGTPGTTVKPTMVSGSVMLTPAMVDANPTNPSVDGGGTLAWTTAPQMGQVSFASDRDSVKLVMPAVANAVDYRAILLSPTVGVTNDGSGHETVSNTTIVCAGYLQRNVSTTTQQLVDTIQFPGITANSHIVIEAIDTTCPFVGVVGPKHATLNRTTKENAEIKAADSATYSVYTEADVNTTFGAMIINGQGPGTQTGMPAPVSAPKVLQRTTVVVSPMGSTMTPPVTTFFDDFSSSDQPTLASSGQNSQSHPYIDIFQNSKWTMEAAAMDIDQYFVDRGQLHTIFADTGADDFSSAVAYPKQLAQLSDTDYLHIVYDVNSITSDRRYWWLSICGSDTAGKTMAANGQPTSYLNPDSSLQEGDGNNPNQSGFNCIDVFPKNGAVDNDLPLGNGTSSPPETDVRILIYGTGKGLTGTNVSPDQYKNGYLDPSWYREMDGTGKFIGPMLDQNNLYAPTTHYDLYVRRNRVVLYADGQQKLCNDFPESLVTMSEAMVGFGSVLYHTSAEHNEISPGKYMKYVYDDLKYFDRRDWDNMGFDNGVQPPSSGSSAFNASDCYVWSAK